MMRSASSRRPCHYCLRASQGKALFKIGVMETMGDDRERCPSRSPINDRHFVSRLIHFATVNPLIVNMLNTTRFQSIAIGSDGIPSIAIFPPGHMLSCIVRSPSGAQNLRVIHIEASFIPSCFCTSLRDPFLDVEGYGAPIFLGELQRLGMISVITT